VFVQVVDGESRSVPIPGKPFDFGTLKQAQAAGDLITLRQRDRRAGRVSLQELLEVAQ